MALIVVGVAGFAWANYGGLGSYDDNPPPPGTALDEDGSSEDRTWEDVEPPIPALDDDEEVEVGPRDPATGEIYDGFEETWVFGTDPVTGNPGFRKYNYNGTYREMRFDDCTACHGTGFSPKGAWVEIYVDPGPPKVEIVQRTGTYDY